MPLVDFTRREVHRLRNKYRLIRDCLAGEEEVKNRQTLYLPMPNPADTSQPNILRYRNYLNRANFYNVTGRTQKGLIGQVFARGPEITVPDYLAFTVKDMTGLGVNATQQAKDMAGEVIGLGRGALFSDFPTIREGEVITQDQINNGDIAPSIIEFKAEQIINWQYVVVGGRRYYTLIVVEEPREVYNAKDFSIDYRKQWRVFRLDDDGFFVHEIYYDNKTAPVATFTPKYGDGRRFDYVPIEFMGAEDNNAEPDQPPLYDLATLNIAHYRNSADYEELCFLVGQPTPVYSGLDQQWVDDNFTDDKGNNVVYLGSTAAIPLPVGGRAELLQASPNQLAAEAMDAKEKRMVALGAKLVENRQVQRTATEAGQDEAAETSILATIADNMSVAYAQAFENAGQYIRRDTNVGVVFKLNSSFDISNTDPLTRAQIIKEWQSEAITWDEMRSALRKAGVATEDDKKAQAKIAEEVKARAEATGENMQLMNPDGAGTGDNVNG